MGCAFTSGINLPKKSYLQFAKFKIDALNMRNQLNYSIFKEQL